jgi:hypothetical protein
MATRQATAFPEPIALYHFSRERRQEASSRIEDTYNTISDTMQQNLKRATEPVTIDELRDKLSSVDEAKFVEWFDRMETNVMCSCNNTMMK